MPSGSLEQARFNGGGILSNNNATITDSTISGNSAGSFGGGILSVGTLTVINSTISGNTAGSFGGGISSNGNAILSGCVTVESNTAGDGDQWNVFNGTVIDDNGALDAIVNDPYIGYRLLAKVPANLLKAPFSSLTR